MVAPAGDEHPREQFPREEVIRPFREEPFEIRARLHVIAGLSERERTTFDRIGIRNLRQRNAEREEDGERSGRHAFHAVDSRFSPEDPTTLNYSVNRARYKVRKIGQTARTCSLTTPPRRSRRWIRTSPAL